MPFLLLLTILVSTGCETLEYRPAAVGKEGDVVVVIDSSSWNGELGDAIRGNVAPYLGTLPAPERVPSTADDADIEPDH